MNLIQIAGHLGADPETRFTPSGQKVVSLRIATNSRRGGQEETIWWRVSLWGDRWDKLVPHLRKGSAVIVIGEMRKPETYTGRDGQPGVSLEINAEVVRFSPFGRSQDERQQGQQSYSAPSSNEPSSPPPAFQAAPPSAGGAGIESFGSAPSAGGWSAQGAGGQPEEDDVPF